MLELELFLRPTVSRPVSLGIGPPFGTLDQMLPCSSSFVWQLRYSAFNASSLTRKRVCSLQCNHSLVRAGTPNNHTLPSHLRLCSLFVASYDSQGLRWRYSNPPPFYYIIYRNSVCTSQESHYVSATQPTRSLRTNNHTLPSHLRLCSLSVASYDSQGLRWRYSNLPPRGELTCGGEVSLICWPPFVSKNIPGTHFC
jgi:hypothetical protein